MQFSIFKSTAWQLIARADWLCWLILLGLFALSVFCVAIMAFKYLSFRRQKKHLEILLSRLKNIHSFNDLISISKEFKDSIGGFLLFSGLTELKSLLDINSKKRVVNKEDADEVLPYISDKDLEYLKLSLDQETGNILMDLESYLPVLSTSAAAAPLIGLFGTIWGLIRSFVDISQDKSTEIATVAPGLAEALVATLAGLIVAIPALIAFHYFAYQVRKFDYNLSILQEKFLGIVKQTFVK
jgi:biopolymer transport protein TolQ